uniref:Uncharacterized protein n=1 Tax=Peronospora matthiolae TaxID=2874970 RepID=A0AAV1UGU7_9STRA
MSSATHSEAPRSPSSASLPSTTELLTDQMKRSFNLETQRRLRSRHVSALDDWTESDTTRVMQDQLCHLKRRCAKLERKLQEKELMIQSLQEQQQLQFPLLVHETMRNLNLMAFDESERQRTANDRPLSHSVMSVMAHSRQDIDVCIHEYEQQIAKLYEENRSEKLKNEMLSECLRDQKHAKSKFMKACRQAKQELQAVKDSGLSQMLVDIEARCSALEKKKDDMADELLVEMTLRKKSESEKVVLANHLEELRCQSTKWEGIVARKSEMLQQARDQICEQQLMIENLTTDLKLADRNTARPSDHFHDCDNAEIEIRQLKHFIKTEQVALHEAKQRLGRSTAENDMHGQGQRAFDDRFDSSEEHVAPCAAQNTFDRVLIQIQHLQCKLRSLRDLLKQYDETNFIDVNALDEENWFREDCAQSSARSCVEYATHLSKSVVESAHYLLELQQIVEDVGARLMGESCALQ